MSSVEARSSMTGSIVGMESAKLLAHELDNLLKPGKSVKQAYHLFSGAAHYQMETMSDDSVTASDSEQSSNGAYGSLVIQKRICTGTSGSCDSDKIDQVMQSEMRNIRMDIMTGNSFKHCLAGSAESMKDLPRVNVYHAVTGEEIGIALAGRINDLSYPPHSSIKELMEYRGLFARRATLEEARVTQKWYTFLEDFRPTAIMIDDDLIDHTTVEGGHLQLGHVTGRITLIM